MVELIPSDANVTVTDDRTVARAPRRRLFLEDEADGFLVDLAATGNHTAFEVLVQRHQPKMRGYAIRILGADADADDVVQETLIAAWDKMASVHNPEAVKSWLMRIVYNKCIDRLRVRQNHLAVIDEDLPAPTRNGPTEVVEILLQNQDLSRVLAELPRNQRRAWLMREFSSCSYSVIAEELGVPSSTVRGLLARARETIGDSMETWR
jgi:RNA polymerase sigma-70 factor (ECF subfamily)